jgi:PII-like signaling protein
LYAEIVHRAHKAGRPVPRSCVEGFGATSAIDRPHVFRLSEDLPMLIVIADEEDRIRSFLPHHQRDRRARRRPDRLHRHQCPHELTPSGHDRMW